ncbi:MAG: RuBisCO accumulation factor 1 [Synechococcus sp.]|nr:RuBisCO accumulation factor 1 [Synechococcus sp.]
MIGQPHTAAQPLSPAETDELFRSLLHKEGTWVEWGMGCQRLQQAGHSAQEIFEQTGFQTAQQNMIIVAAQVYQSIEKSDAPADLLAYCRGPRSDVLYELRVLSHTQRAIAAKVCHEKSLEFDEAKELARAMQEFARLPQIPDGFTEHPGDAMAYQAWRSAKQKKDLQDRTRLIAKGLKFVHSGTARQKIEQLLSDLTAKPTKAAPLLPLYRYDEDTNVPLLIPVAGTLPLESDRLLAISPLQQVAPFNLVTVPAETALVPLPSWQNVLTAGDPVVIFHQTDQLPQPIPGKPEPVLVLLDRQQTTWNDHSYFAVDVDGQVELAWFAEAPIAKILGQVLLVMRPKKILDENNLREPWQMDD